MALDVTEFRQVNPAEMTRLRRWASRKPCIALMGEFSAGKSTLLNFLIGEKLLPTKAIATELPPIWFSHGTEGSFWVDQDWNQHFIEPKDVTEVPVDARFARIYLESDILETCDVIDTPGISDPNLAAESWRTAAGFANMVLWCTSATQAWRETERGTWRGMPTRLRANSILVVTRADKLQSEIDREKVARRMTREAGDLFSGVVFMATPDAVKAKADLMATGESPLWKASGAEELIDRMAAQFEKILDRRRDLLARYRIGGTGLPGSTPRPVARVAPKIDLVPTPKSLDETVEVGVREAASILPVRPVRVSSEPSRRSERPTETEATDKVMRLRQEVGEGPAFAALARRDEPAEDLPELVAEEADAPEDTRDDVVAASAPEIVTGTATAVAAMVAAEAAVETVDETAAEVAAETAVEDADFDALDLDALVDEIDDLADEPSAEADKKPAEEVEIIEQPDGDVSEDDAPEVARELAEEAVSSDEDTPATEAGSVNTPAPVLPAQVQAWRDIVKDHEVSEANAQLVSMIDQLLLALFATSSEADSGADDATEPEASEAPSGAEVTTPGWRRLA